MKTLVAFIILPFLLASQVAMRVSSGTSIVSNNDAFITLRNANLVNAASDHLGDGVIWCLSGTQPQSNSGISIASFYGLRLNNATGFALSTATTISKRLDMIVGDIDATSYALQVGTNTSNPGTINWTAGSINGTLTRWFAPTINSTQASGIFPIGFAGINKNVCINYTQAPTEGGRISVTCRTGMPSMTDTYAGLPLYASDGMLIQNYDNDAYYEIVPENYALSLNTKPYTLSMRATNLTTITDRAWVRLLKSPGPTHSTWVPCGTHSSIIGTNNSDFVVVSDNVMGFSWFNFGSPNENPLPVELVSFDGVTYPAFNMLRWTTASEHNSSYFALERSEYGSDWHIVGTKPAADNSTQKTNYSMLDAISSFTMHYYRLIQYDVDGNYKIYGPIMLDNTSGFKRVIKTVNMAGQEVGPDATGILFEIYEDGTSKKIIR